MLSKIDRLFFHTHLYILLKFAAHVPVRCVGLSCDYISRSHQGARRLLQDKGSALAAASVSWRGAASKAEQCSEFPAAASIS